MTMFTRRWAALLVAGFITGRGIQGADTLTGAGATFPYPLYAKWFAAFEKRFPGAAIEYRAVGSGSGIEALAKGDVDFAGSDIPFTDEQLAALHGKVRMIPTVMGAVVPIYHLTGVLEDIHFTAEALAGIYLGRITRWNDPVLKAANRGVALPARNIVVVHRSDRSGTTFIWTNYLSKTSSDWKATVGSGDTVRWPIGSSSEGNEGVAGAVSNTPDSIGYVEFIYALQNRLSYGSVRNSAGRFVQADLTSVPAAAADFIASIRDDFRVSIINAPGRNSYPIAAFTYLLVPQEFRDPVKEKLMNNFLAWMLTSGQNQCAALGYAALPREIAEKAQRLVATQ
jgi:phosphate transport system substrate-binding protein